MGQQCCVITVMSISVAGSKINEADAATSEERYEIDSKISDRTIGFSIEADRAYEKRELTVMEAPVLERVSAGVHVRLRKRDYSTSSKVGGTPWRDWPLFIEKTQWVL